MGTANAQRSVDIGSGHPMPMIGFGTYDIDGETAYTSVRHALDAGYRHIDTAYGYRNEEQIGRALADSGIPRGQVFLTTKIPSRRLRTAAQIAEQSLRALRTDYVDLWLIHDPPGGEDSIALWEFFLCLREKGMAAAVGVSNYTTERIDELIAATGAVPAVNQIMWTPAAFDRRRLDALRSRGIHLEGFSALRRADLDDRRLTAIAAAHSVSAAQVVLRWHVQHGITTLPRSTRPPRIRENIDVWDFTLSDAQMASIDAMSTLG